MAARENQGLQIALIIFVMLTIILIVTTYLFFSNYQQEREKNKTLAADKASSDKAAHDAQSDSERFKAILGVATTDNLKVVEEQAKKDIDLYGKTIPEPDQNYRFLVKYLGTELNNANTRITDLTADNVKLNEKIKTDEVAKVAEMAKYTEKLTAVSTDLQKVREEFTHDREEMAKDKATLSKRFETTRKEHEDLSKKSGEEIAALKGENEKFSGRLRDINDKKLNEEKANAVADGKITWVNQRLRTVWINLGAADGLRRQTMFSVVGGDEANPLEASRKGKIEVVRLKDRHLAEARIVDDDLSDPLMPGDQLYSPTWQPGHAEHFALAGTMDIDKDNKSDLKLIRDLISRNGGVVDEEVEDDGKRTGQMTIHTKYLVVGEPPTKEGKKLDSWSEIRLEAQTLGIKTIDIHDFLDYMGYKPEDRTVSLDKDARSEDFKPRLPNNIQRVMPDSVRKDFRKPTAKSKDD